MKAQSLIAKLDKMNVSHKIFDLNGYNKDIEFTINGKTYKAGFTSTCSEIQDFCRSIGYDQSSQETQRLFFTNFNRVLENAKR